MQAPTVLDIRPYTIANGENKATNRMTVWSKETGCCLVFFMLKHFDRFRVREVL